MSKEYSTAVAATHIPNCVKYPAPTFTATWLSPTTLSIGCGGGKKFGMVNMMKAIRFDEKKGGLVHGDTTPCAVVEGVVWAVAAVDGEIGGSGRNWAVTHPASVTFININKDESQFTTVATYSLENSNEKEPNKKCIASLPHVKNLWVVSRDDSVLELLRLDGKNVHRIWQGKCGGLMEDMHASPTAPLLATVGDNGGVTLWRIDHGVGNKKTSNTKSGGGSSVGLHQVAHVNAVPGAMKSVKKTRWAFCRWSIDGSVLFVVVTSPIVGSVVQRYRVCEKKHTLHLEREQLVSTDVITCMDVSDTEKLKRRYLLYGTNEGTVGCILQSNLVKAGKVRSVHDGPITSISVDPSGKRVGTTDLSHYVRVTPMTQYVSFFFVWFRVMLMLLVAGIAVVISERFSS